MAFNTRTFFTRTASAAVFVALLLGCTWTHPIALALFYLLVSLVGIYELYKIMSLIQKKQHSPYIAMLMAAAGFTLLYFGKGIHPYILLLYAPFALYILAELFKPNPLIRLSSLIISFFYVILPCLLLVNMSGSYINTPSFSPQPVIGMIFFIWINDTGAYLTGSFIGKHKMYERVSPGKTWEGTIGGVILTMSLAYVVYLIFPQMAYRHWLVIAAIVSVFGTLGDLVESMLKRQAGVKDSGHIMPGHGGVLDRFDSLFFATPFVFAYLSVMGLL